MSVSAIVTRGFLFGPELVVTAGYLSGVPILAVHGGPAGRPAGKKKKKKDDEDGNWNALIWPNETAKPKVKAPVTFEPVIGEPEPERQPVPVLVSKELVGSVTRKTVQMDRATRARIDEKKRRLRAEIDDEEALLLLGAFD